MIKALSHLIIILVSVSTMAPQLFADENPQKTLSAVPIESTFRHYFYSSKTDHDYQIDVALPLSYHSGNKQYPVIYLTDSNSNFPIVVGNLRVLQLGREMPEAIIVGIGYKDANIQEVMSYRSHDLTPTKDDISDKEAIESPIYPLLPGTVSGGAGKFIAFIDQELKPYINDTYRTDKDDQTYVGHSLGALFGLYVLFNHTASFDKYVIASPSIWWDGKVSARYEENYAKANNTMPKQVFFSVGKMEEPGMASDMLTMFKAIKSRGYPRLDIGHYLLEGETHLSSIGPATSRGLRFVFRKQMPAPFSDKQ